MTEVKYVDMCDVCDVLQIVTYYADDRQTVCAPAEATWVQCAECHALMDRVEAVGIEKAWAERCEKILAEKREV